MIKFNYIYMYILCLLDTFLFTFLLSPFINKTNKRYKYLNIVFVLVFSIISFILTIFRLEFYVKAIVLSILIYTYISLYNMKSEYKTLIVTLYYFLLIGVEILVYIFLFRVLNFSSNRNNAIFTTGLISKFIIFIFIIYIIKLLKKESIVLPRKINCFLNFILLTSVFLLMLLLHLTIILEFLDDLSFILFTICFLIIVVNIGVFYFYYNQNRYYKKLQQQQIQSIYDKSNKEYINKNKIQSQMVSKMWHDINNHLKILKIMLKTNQDSNTNSYFQSIQKKFEDIPNEIKTGNIIADVILNKKHQDASIHNISFNVNAVIPPKICIEKTDFSSILFNTIDNAIEANLNLSKDKKNTLILIYIHKADIYIILLRILPLIFLKKTKSISIKRITLTQDMELI